MTQKHVHPEYKILANLLEMASDEFSNHGCNDYELDDTPENRALMDLALRWNAPNGPEEEWETRTYQGKIITMDYFLMSYFSHLFKEIDK